MPHKDPEVRRAYHQGYSKTHREQINANHRAFAARYPERVKANSQRWAANNPEKLRAKNQRYEQNNRLKRNHRRRQRYATHPERFRAYSAKYQKNHPEQILTRWKRWYEANATKQIQRALLYAKMHPEYARTSAKRRRARKANAPINDFTDKQWREMQRHYHYRCSYCGIYAKGKLTQDHLTPLSKSGSHTKNNIVPACRRCNCKKHTGPPLKPVQPLLL